MRTNRKIVIVLMRMSRKIELLHILEQKVSSLCPAGARLKPIWREQMRIIFIINKRKGRTSMRTIVGKSEFSSGNQNFPEHIFVEFPFWPK